MDSPRFASLKSSHVLIAVFALICAAAMFLFPATAHAAVKMQVGDIGYEASINDSEDLDSITVKSSNPKVVAVEEDETADFSGYFLYARDYGTATITVVETRREEVEDDDDVLDSEEEFVDDEYTFKVTVSAGKFTKTDCDGLFKGKTYSKASLFRYKLVRQWAVDDDDEYEGPSSALLSKAPLPKGKFVKGKGYKVKAKGKKVQFTKTGKVTLKYKVGKKIKKIVIPTVHSTSKLSDSVKKSIKKKALSPSSVRISSKKLKWDKKLGVYYYYVKFSAVNSYNVRLACKCSVWYKKGKVVNNW